MGSERGGGGGGWGLGVGGWGGLVFVRQREDYCLNRQANNQGHLLLTSITVYKLRQKDLVPGNMQELITKRVIY